MDHGQVVAEGTPRGLKQQVAGDAILITLRRGDHAAERAAPVLRREPYVRELTTDDGHVRLYVDDGGTALPQMIRTLDHAGIGVSSMSMSEPTLDDVFLRQTGRSLRDGADAGGDQSGRTAEIVEVARGRGPGTSACCSSATWRRC